VVCVGGRECILCGAEFKKFSVRKIMPKERSKVWGKFTKLSSTVARCKDCTATLKYCGNTTNLWAHLHAQHKSSVTANTTIQDRSDPDDPPAAGPSRNNNQVSIS